MKNRQSAILVLITCMFISFTLGFLTGRTTAPGDTIVAQIPKITAEPETEPAVDELSIVITEAVTEAATEASTEPETVPATTAETAPPMVSEPVPPTNPPTVAETTPPKAPETQASSGLININTATLAQLDTLPGIGPVIAQRIIDYRQAHGPFTSVTQLIQVDGIGEKRLAAIIDLVTIG